MSETPRHEVLAARLLAGVEALRSGRTAEAAEALADVVDAPDFAAASELTDVRARALGLLGQALIEEARLDEAGAAIDEALRLTRDLGDTDGLRELRTLNATLAETRQRRATEAAARARSSRLAEVELSEIEANVKDPVALTDVLIRKANAELDAGRAGEASAVARRALDLALRIDDVRSIVLAHLSVARASPEAADAQIRAAWRAADRANEFNLVGAVARAAQLAGVELAVQVGPDMGSR